MAHKEDGGGSFPGSMVQTITRSVQEDMLRGWIRSPDFLKAIVDGLSRDERPKEVILWLFPDDAFQLTPLVPANELLHDDSTFIRERLAQVTPTGADRARFITIGLENSAWSSERHARVREVVAEWLREKGVTFQGHLIAGGGFRLQS